MKAAVNFQKSLGFYKLDDKNHRLMDNRMDTE